MTTLAQMTPEKRAQVVAEAVAKLQAQISDPAWVEAVARVLSEED